MKIGFAGPIDVQLLGRLRGFDGDAMPEAYAVPMNSLLVSALMDAGCEVSVFGLSDQVEELKSWTFGRLNVHLGRYRKSGRGRDFFKQERADLVEAMRADSCDVMNAHWTYEFAQAALAVDSETVVSVRDWAPAILMQMPDPYRFIRLLMAVQVYRKAKRLTVNSPYMLNCVSRWTKPRPRLVPNGLSDEVFKPSAQWKAADGSQTIIAINRGFFKRKNLPNMLRAFAAARRVLPHLSLELIGRQSEPDGVGYDWAVKNGLDEGVKFVGVLPFHEVQERIARANLLVHPSHEESFGMVLIEAMAKAVPIIGGQRSGAVPWVLDEGKAGILLDVSKPEAMAEGMLRVLQDEAVWEHYSQAGFTHASDSFRMSHVAAQFMEIYGQVLAFKRRAIVS